MRWKEAMGKPRKWGVCEPTLKPRQAGKAHGGKAKVSNLGNPAVRDYRGAFGNAAIVEMRTQFAIEERADLVTLHLQPARRSSIPTEITLAARRGLKEAWSKDASR